jgi:hypothetical protein
MLHRLDKVGCGTAYGKVAMLAVQVRAHHNPECGLITAAWPPQHSTWRQSPFAVACAQVPCSCTSPGPARRVPSLRPGAQAATKISHTLPTRVG